MKVNFQVFVDVSVWQVCKFNTNHAIKFHKLVFREDNFAVGLSKDVFKNMKRACKTFSCSWLFINRLFNKRLYHWEKTHASVITLLTANIVWKMLIPQDLHRLHRKITVNR